MIMPMPMRRTDTNEAQPKGVQGTANVGSPTLLHSRLATQQPQPDLTTTGKSPQQTFFSCITK